MNNILFLILFSVFLIISCKKDNSTTSCERTNTTLGSTNYTEQDTIIYKGKITLEVVDLSVGNCRARQNQFDFKNLTDNNIEVKIYNDTTFKELFSSHAIVPRKNFQAWLGPMQKGSKALVPLIKVKYR